MRLCYFDLETTGLDPHEDRIVEIAWLSATDLEEGDAYDTLINPEVPIPAEATEVHGISDEDVAEAPTFEEVAEAVELAVRDAVLIGYNIRRFDTVMLDAELRRAGRDGLPRDEHGMIDVLEVDLYEVWRRAEPRDLGTAVERFASVKNEDRHRAAGDVAVLPFVLGGMAERFDLFGQDGEEGDGILRPLLDLSRPKWEVDRSGKFRRQEDGTVIFNFGKHDGVPVKTQKGYLKWMLGSDFPPDTKRWVRFFLKYLER